MNPKLIILGMLFNFDTKITGNFDVGIKQIGTSMTVKYLFCSGETVELTLTRIEDNVKYSVNRYINRWLP